LKWRKRISNRHKN